MRGNDSTSRRLYTFAAGATGDWFVTCVRAVAGAPLAAAAKLSLRDGETPSREGTAWVLRGVTSNERYVTRFEKERLVAKQEGLGRREATCAALIPIRKSEAWWQLPQDERRRIFEERSKHVVLGLEYLPAIARRLHHCRDLGTAEPFDFLTWFEFAPAYAPAFDELVGRLRETEEWRYVEREVDIRLRRE
ncbi:MAG: chlorite dismutase family protein [Sulfurifustis sp.]